MRKKQQCYFITNNIRHVDYRDVHLLRQFVNQYGKVLPRKRTGLSAPFQRKVTVAVKRARYMALMPYVKQ